MGGEGNHQSIENEDVQDQQGNSTPLSDDVADKTPAGDDVGKGAADGEDKPDGLVAVQHGETELRVDPKFVKAGKLNLPALLKSQQDLRKKLGSKSGDVPEEYTVPEGLSIDVESPLFKGVADAAKAAGVSQEQFAQLVQGYAVTADPKVQLEQLQKHFGGNFEKTMAETEIYWLGVVQAEGASPEVAQVYDSLQRTAEGVIFLNEMMKRSREPSFPDAPRDSGQAMGTVTFQDIVDAKVAYKINPSEEAKARIIRMVKAHDAQQKKRA